MNETDSQIKYDRQLSKSRPRPGTSSSATANSLLAPPPPSSRKNSSANDTPDLISFSSPPATRSDIIEFCNQQRLVKTLSIHSNVLFNIFLSYNSSPPVMSTSMIHQPPPPGFKYWPTMGLNTHMNPMMNVPQQHSIYSRGYFQTPVGMNIGFRSPLSVSPTIQSPMSGTPPQVTNRMPFFQTTPTSMGFLENLSTGSQV